MKKYLFIPLCLIILSINAQTIRVSILGDSYSTFEGYHPCDTFSVWYHEKYDSNKTNVYSVTQTWWYLFIKNHQYRLDTNSSFSGATICYTGYNKQDYSNRSLLNRAKYLGNPDIIFIFGATNDNWANSPLGEYIFGNWEKAELYMFRPAMAKMLDFITTRYLNTKIYVIINSGLKTEYVESMHVICNHYNIKYIDLLNIDKKNGHPTIQGMIQISTQIEKSLN